MEDIESSLEPYSREWFRYRFRRMGKFYHDHERLLTDDDQSKNTQIWAWAYWKRWPEIKGYLESWIRDFENKGFSTNQQTEHDESTDTLIVVQPGFYDFETRIDSSPQGLRRLLAEANEAATAWFIRQGIYKQIDVSNIGRARTIITDLIVSGDKEAYRLLWGDQAIKNWGRWPDCLGSHLWEMPPAKQQAILDSQAAFDRIIAHLEIDLIHGERIPPDKRSRPMTKKEAAKLLGQFGDEKRAVEWLNGCIEDKIIHYQEVNRQSGFFHVDDFPTDVQGKISPQRKLTGN